MANEKEDVKHPTRPPMSDEMEGIVRDPVIWNGKTVSYVKDIGTQDREYNANVRQVLIQIPGGGTQVVPESEILREKTIHPSEQTQLNRPDQAPVPVAERSVAEKEDHQKQVDAKLKK